MVKSIRHRLDNQGGFTLIELLVVMIIISILMAVAVPVFLSQKQKALATNAKVNAKHVQDTIESCAAGTTTGTLTQLPAVNCTLPAQLTALEPSLTDILAPALKCGVPAVVCVAIAAGPTGADTSYILTSSTNSPVLSRVAFILTRLETGVSKSCSGPAASLKSMCPAGTW